MLMVRSGALDGYAALTRGLGGNPVALIDAAGLDESQFRDPNAYISYRKMALLLELTARACRQPLFGLHLAYRQGVSVLGDLMLVLSQPRTVEDVIGRINHHLYLHANGVRVERRDLDDEVELELAFAFTGELGIGQLVQLSLGHLANFCSQLVGVAKANIPLHLREDAPEDAAAISRATGYRRVRFRAPSDCVRLPASWLKRETRRDDSAMQEHLQDHLRNLQARYPDSLLNQVRDVIGRLLPSGECSIELVAATLDLSPRVLQKRLQALDSGFGRLLREVRQGIAEQHLGRGSLSVTDLALHLGYAEVSVFSRQFKAWTGRSPRAWRAGTQA